MAKNKNQFSFQPSRHGRDIYLALQKIRKFIDWIDDRVDLLEYTAISISALTGGSNNEKGSTVANVTLNWTISGSATVASQTLTDTTLLSTDRTHTFTGVNLTTNKTYTLGVVDVIGGTDSEGETIAFYDKRHWGVSTETSLTTAQILGLANSEFASSYSQSRTFDATGGYYLYFAWPTAFGASPTFTVNGLEDSSWQTATVSHTNASGYTVNYDWWRSNNLLSGSGISVVVS